MQKMRELREAAGIPLMRAAQAANIAYTTLWRCENGYAKLEDEIVQKLRKFYAGEIVARAQRGADLMGQQ
jgi:hypothetical protein